MAIPSDSAGRHAQLDVVINLAGTHNVLNALAAIAVARRKASPMRQSSPD